jgi:serine/threonine protein kinase
VPAVDLTGKIIGGYRLERVIGSGALGTVYECAHRDTGQQAALKVLPAALFPGRSFVERFSQELKLLARLRNPGIVKVFDAGRIREGGLYVVMERLEGKTLSQLLAAAPGGLMVAEAFRLAEGICAVLEAAHGVGVIHRNLRPSNIFLVKSGKRLQPKLLDFGVNAAEPAPGQHDYRAPEQLRPLPINEGADLFCLGLTLYEMLTGKRVSHEDDPPPPPSTHRRELTQAIDELVLELLAKFPESRPPSARRVRDALAALRADLPHATGEHSFPPRPSRPPPAEEDPKTEIPAELLRGGRSVPRAEVPPPLKPVPPRSNPGRPSVPSRPSRPAAPELGFDEVTQAAPREVPRVSPPLQVRPSGARPAPPQSTVQVSPEALAEAEVPATRVLQKPPLEPPRPRTSTGEVRGQVPLGDGPIEGTMSREMRRRKFQPPADAEAIERQRSRKRLAAWVLGSVAMAGIVWLETRPIPHYGPRDPATVKQGGTTTQVTRPASPDEFDPSAPVAPDEFDPSKPDPSAPADDLAPPRQKRGGSKVQKGKRGR